MYDLSMDTRQKELKSFTSVLNRACARVIETKITLHASSQNCFGLEGNNQSE